MLAGSRANRRSNVITKTGDDSYTLFSDQYEQTYHSSFGAVNESLHVFFRGSGIDARLRAGKASRVLEIGFGLGLNCLLCANCAETNKATLDYHGIEHQPISATTFTNLRYRELLDYPALADNLAPAFSSAESGISGAPSPHCIEQSTIRADLGSHTQLTLYVADAASGPLADHLNKLQAFDAIFLDAFSPDHNPECWTLAFFEQLANLLTTDGRLATYCVKGSVRRNLESAGFELHKYPGPEGKREVLWACKQR